MSLVDLVLSMEAAGCTARQIAQVVEDHQRRLALRRMLRRAQAAVARGLDAGGGVAPAPESAIAPKEDSAPAASAVPVERMPPIKARAINGIAAALSLRPGARKVAQRLVHHFNVGTGLCFPGVRRLADDLGLDKRSVRRSISQLESAGLLQRQVNAGRGHTNVYRLDLERMAALSVPIAAKEDSAQMRTHESVKEDSGVRQNKGRKQSFQLPRARGPDRRQRELPLMVPVDGGLSDRDSAARRWEQSVRGKYRDHDVQRSMLAAGWLLDGESGALTDAELRQSGGGLRALEAHLAATGPPRNAATG